MSLSGQKHGDAEEPPSLGWVADTRDNIRNLEANLLDQGVKLFPSGRSGQHAELLWHKIKRHLFTGGALQIRAGVLKLDWHREELRRARKILVEMGLIQVMPGGLYKLKNYDWLDEELRERFSELKMVEEVLVALSSIGTKSKTHMSRRR
jgi:hypothetical protein